MSIQKGDSIAVIRSAGERTRDLCLHLLHEQMPSERVFMIEEAPFEAALRRCYELGMESGATWMLTVDADVLLFPRSVERLLAEADELPPKFVHLEGRVFDKVLGIWRKAGHRVYRVSCLEKALEHVPDAGSKVRPESSVLRALVKEGFRSRVSRIKVGAHDFEQTYADLYRKSYVHCQKHPDELPELLRRCSRNRSHDPDFQAVVIGILDGLLCDSANSICMEVLHSPVKSSLGLSEKDPLLRNSYERTLRNVQEYIEHFGSSDCFWYAQVASDYRDRTPQTEDLLKRIRCFGLLGGTSSYLGRKLKQIGTRLERFGELDHKRGSKDADFQRWY